MDEVEIRWTPGLKTPAQDGTAADEPHFLIRTLAAEFSNGRKVEPHSHPWGQSIYAISGVMSVWTTEGSWVAPPHSAVWAPAGVRHGIRFTGAFTTLL